MLCAEKSGGNDVHSEMDLDHDIRILASYYLNGKLLRYII